MIESAQDKPPGNDLIAVGRFIKPHGLRGELVFLPYVIDMELLPDLIDQPVILRPLSPAQPSSVTTGSVYNWRYFNQRVLMRMDGCSDISQAEAWRNLEMLIPRAMFPTLPEGEFYWFEIEGLDVYDAAGQHYGAVTEIIHTGSNDVYVVSDGTSEILIPALKDTVRTIDLEQGSISLLVTREWLE